MAPPQDVLSAPEHRKKPSNRAIAFAVAIVSSKPDEITVRDYIALLRQHVAKGRRENALSAAYRHLDRSAWWRSECDRVKEALRLSEAATVDALRETELLKAKLELAKTTAVGPTKRKRADPDIILAPRSPKKARRDAPPPREATNDFDIGAEFDVKGVDAGTQDLMRALCMLNTYIKPGIGVEREAASMTYYVVRAAGTISRVVTEAVEQRCKPDVEDDGPMKTALIASSRVSAAIIVSFTRLFRAKDGASFQGQVIHAFVKMFDKLIDTFSIVSAAEIASSAGLETAEPLSTASPTKKACRRAHNRVNIKDNATLNLLTSFVSGILKQLDAKHGSHTSLFEGLMFVIISKLGSRLHLFVFDRSRPNSIEDGIAGFQRDNKSESSAPQPCVPENLAIQQAKLEAPYLLHLLKHCLSLTPTFLDANFNPKNSKQKAPPKAGSISKVSLSLAARERIQRTLVNAVFGTEGMGGKDDMFLECLRMPVFAGAKVPTPKVKEAEVGEWFKEEVWRLLGWEVIGKEVEV